MVNNHKKAIKHIHLKHDKNHILDKLMKLFLNYNLKQV